MVSLSVSTMVHYTLLTSRFELFEMIFSHELATLVLVKREFEI